MYFILSNNINFFAVRGFEFRISGFLSRHSTTWTMPPALYLSGRVSHFCLGWPQTLILLLMASRVGGITYVCHHAQMVY
jgi:hypothetical protein